MPRPAIDLFRETFGTTPRAAASAPGRVNLIGEHTDYNGGPVLPIAIAQRTSAAVAFRAEHDHVGVRCGVMDQTISALGKRDHAVLLECASLEAKQIPFSARLLLVNTGVRHDLSAGGLNQRRAECEAAVKRLKV